MRALYLGIAAALCVAALALKLFDVSDIGAVIALLVAGIFLVLGLKLAAAERTGRPIVLDGEKAAALRELKARGDDGAAMRQVQLWFRDASAEQARRIVHDLD